MLGGEFPPRNITHAVLDAPCHVPSNVRLTTLVGWMVGKKTGLPMMTTLRVMFMVLVVL